MRIQIRKFVRTFGVGPGDPELLTLKAHRILKEAGWLVFCPAAASFAYDIVKKFVEEGKAEVVNLVI